MNYGLNLSIDFTYQQFDHLHSIRIRAIMPHHKTVCLLLAALMILPSANCVHINTRIVMKAKNTVEKITADSQDASSNNNFSPFVHLPPQVWNFNAFVGTREDPHQRGQMISFSLEVDSGDTWIRQQSYDGSESPTFKSDPTKPFDMVVDLFGTVKGYTASDDMNLIGYDFNFTAQPFGLVTDDSHYSPTWASDGKLGLAWPGAGSPTVHTSLATSLAPLKRFTISFDQQDPLTSYALFGQVDCDNCRDDWAVVPLAGPQNYWQFSLLGLCASDGFCLKFGENRLAMLSNRVQFIHGPSAYISEFAKNVGATQQVDSQGRHWYQIECSRMSSLPNIKLKLQHNQFLVLSPNDYAKEVQGNCVLLFAHIESSRSLLYARNVDWVIGLPVLRPYCQLYDIQRKELAFGRAQNFADAN